MPSSTVYLIALSETSAYALYPLIGLYWLLAVYIVAGGWPRSGERQHRRTLWLVALPVTAFFALWLSGGAFWSLVLWMYWGDVGWYTGKRIAVIIAIFVSSILLLRLTAGRVGHPYLRFNAWCVGLCALFFCAIYFIHFAEGIDGWTARGAAENKFAYWMKESKFYPAHLARRVVDETTPLLADRGGKAFALYIGDECTADIVVVPYYRWWWSVSNLRKFPYGDGELSISEQLQILRESLNDPSSDR